MNVTLTPTLVEGPVFPPNPVGQAWGGASANGSPAGAAGGPITPAAALGYTLWTLAYATGGGLPDSLYLVMPPGTPQNFFQSLSIQVGGGAVNTYTEASATFALLTATGGAGGNIPTWKWAAPYNPTYVLSNWTVTFTGVSTSPIAGQGDITDPGAWADPAGNIPPLSYQNVPQALNYPNNGDGRYWFVADAYAPTPPDITFIGDPAFLTGTFGLLCTITQAANDGSALYVAYSTDGGTTFSALQLGPSAQGGSLLTAQQLGALAGAASLVVKVYASGGTANANAVPWNVAVAITRNVNEKSSWDAPNPYDPISYNCECADNVVPTSTLAQLRTRLLNRLGFKALLAETTGQTLSSMQTTLMQRLGFSNQAANPPPGMAALTATLINEAQQTLYTRFAQDGYADAAPPLLANPTDPLTLNNIAVQMLAVALGKLHYGQPDGQAMMKMFETYLAELYKRSPPNLAPTINEFLIDAQLYLYRRYSQLHTRRLFRWKMNPGQRFYSLKDSDEDVLCNYRMDPNKTIEWAGVQDSRNVWYPLIEGIEPQLYTMISKPWRPARYEIRQCIEIYPAPDQTYWLWMKAHFGLMAFVQDTDSTTIDAELVFLQALANAKAHFNQRDANNIEAQANAYRKELIAGTHGTNRYIPGSPMVPPAIRPSLISFDGG